MNEEGDDSGGATAGEKGEQLNNTGSFVLCCFVCRALVGRRALSLAQRECS
jgi:hypothetical protein